MNPEDNKHKYDFLWIIAIIIFLLLTLGVLFFEEYQSPINAKNINNKISSTFITSHVERIIDKEAKIVCYILHDGMHFTSIDCIPFGVYDSINN